MIVFSWNPLNWLRWWRCDHEWRGWLYAYPTYTSVAQYNECERCGMRRRNWIVKPSEKYVSESEKERRAKPDVAVSSNASKSGGSNE